MRPCFVACLLAYLLAPWSARAADPAREAGALIESGRAAEAVELLKAALASAHGEMDLRWWLVRAYLADGNDTWALRTLADLSRRNPDDCEPVLWSAYVLMRQGALEDAREALEGAGCPAGSPDEARRALLQAELARLAGDEARAREGLERAREADLAYREDREAMIGLTRELDPGYQAPLTGRLELQLGWTENARAGSPLDPAEAGKDMGSVLGQATLAMRLLAPTGRWVRPTLELEGRTTGFTAEAGEDLSFLMLGARPGLLLGSGAPSFLLAYRIEGLLLSGGDRYSPGPNWFYLAHRGELDVEVLPSLTLFTGAGRREFREQGRSRTEFDLGLGGGLPLGEIVRLLGAGSARYQDADKDPYDLWGLSLMLSVDVRLPLQLGLRAGAFLALDHYPRSAGYFDAANPTEDRLDFLARLSTSLMSPPLGPGLKMGLSYEFAERLSTAEPYAYRDHRALVKIQWSFSVDPLLPEDAGPGGARALDHGQGSAELEERIQDLLRQDEAAQRSSSCVE